MTIHYNVPGKERKHLAQTIGAWLEEDAKYAGVPSCAYRIGNFTIDKDGNFSAEEADEETVERLMEHLCDEGFECDLSAETAQPEETGEPEQPEPDGITIQMPADKANTAFLRQIIGSKAELIKEALGIEDLTITEEEDRVSFPWFKADSTPEEIKAYSEFISALCKMSTELKHVNAKEKAEPENKKYAFRCFLLRLGFIGDEYKQTRKIMLSKLEGSSAFKSGKKGGTEK